MGKCRNCMKYFLNALKFEKSTNVYASLEPIYYISKALGLSPYNYAQNGETAAYTLSTIGNVYNILLLVSFTGYYVYGTENRTDQGFVHRNLINKGIDTFQLYSVVSVMVFGILANTFRQKALIEAVKQIYDLDVHLENINIHPHHNTTRKCTFFGSLAILTTYLTLECMNCSMYIKQIATFSNICFFMCIVPLMINGILVGQFIAFVLIIKHRYQLVNVALAKLQNSAQERTLARLMFNLNSSRFQPLKITDGDKVSARSAQRIVHYCSIVHAQLEEISCLINKAFEVQILINVTLSFIGFTTYAYYCFDGLVAVIFMLESDGTLYDIITSILWALSKLAHIFFISFACTATCAEGKKTGKLLYKIDQRFEKELADEVTIFSKQLLHWETSFTACGFFELDMKLFYSVVCASATYLMILLQLEGANN